MSKTNLLFDSSSALNSIRSQSFGRRVYCVEQDHRTWWIKQQLRHVNAEYERGFLNELDIYAQLNALESPQQPILCQFSISDRTLQDEKNGLNHKVDCYMGQALSVAHAEALFAKKSAEFSVAEVWHVLHQSLVVLKHLHQLHFIHGDLKAEHFRWTAFGATLIDFEQTCHIDAVGHFANTATPRYMAPELFHGQAKSYVTDIYALGIIWYEWLTGRKLSANSYYDWAVLHCQQLQVDLDAPYRPILSILRQMLAKQKTDRFQTISEIQQTLIKA